MSKQATESTLSKINRLIGVDESYKAPERIMGIISDKDLASEIFKKFLEEFDFDLSYEWFNKYFEDEHADRKNRKQDFQRRSRSRIAESRSCIAGKNRGNDLHSGSSRRESW